MTGPRVRKAKAIVSLFGITLPFSDILLVSQASPIHCGKRLHNGINTGGKKHWGLSQRLAITCLLATLVDSCLKYSSKFKYLSQGEFHHNFVFQGCFFLLLLFPPLFIRVF